MCVVRVISERLIAGNVTGTMPASSEVVMNDSPTQDGLISPNVKRVVMSRVVEATYWSSDIS